MTDESGAYGAEGWYHASRSTGAHFFDAGRPLCQDSDPGTVSDLGNPERLIGRTCEDCTRLRKAEALHAVKMAALANDE